MLALGGLGQRRHAELVLCVCRYTVLGRGVQQQLDHVAVVSRYGVVKGRVAIPVDTVFQLSIRTHFTRL